jgi:FkbM family methyltransferase
MPINIAIAGGLSLILSFSSGCRPGVQDLVQTIHEKDALYRAGRPLRAVDEIHDKRLADQASLLEEYRRNPELFIGRIPKKERHYLFDAVIDPQTMIRVGRPGDGGKWVCNPQLLGEHPIVYSFGVGDEISFDTGMAGMFGAQVHMFDPNPAVAEALPSPAEGYVCGAGRLFYHAVGLGPVSTEKGHEFDLVIKGKKCEVRPLMELARSFHHSRVDILKIDIEGGEFSALREILSSGTLSALDIKMILVEFHFWNQGLFKDFLDLVGSLAEAGYLIYRKEFNAANIKCAEYAFVKAPLPDPGRNGE